MGQYYLPILLNKTEKGVRSQIFYSHNYNNGLKLMEHSYVGNNFVETILTQLYNKPRYVAWVGDYHDEDDFDGQPLKEDFLKAYKKKTYSTPKEVTDFSYNKYIINRDTKEYIDMKKYCELDPADDWDCQVHPLPLLTAIGNGRGGGDFWNEDQLDLVGNWACNLLEVRDNAPGPDYTDITEDVLFVERN